jgi:urease accessory protein UreH
VRGGSYLRLVGRPLIPFAGAAVIQSTVVSTARDSACLLLECGCPGRTQMGEAWAFRHLAYHLTVLRDGAVIYRERYRLRPPAVPLGPAGFGGSLGWASCIAVGDRAVAELEALRPALAGAGVVSTCGLIADDVAVARVLDRDGTLISGIADLVGTQFKSPRATS